LKRGGRAPGLAWLISLYTVREIKNENRSSLPEHSKGKVHLRVRGRSSLIRASGEGVVWGGGEKGGGNLEKEEPSSTKYYHVGTGGEPYALRG